MATQTLEIDYVPGQTLTAKLFAIGSDTVVQTASSVTEQVNRSGRYRAAFTDAPAGDYMMRLFNGGVGASSDNYTLGLVTATFQPWSELKPSAGGGGGGTNGTGSFKITATVRRSTDNALIQGVRVSISGTTTYSHTNALGVAELNVDAGSYTLTFSQPVGFEPEPDLPVTVAANVSETILMVPTTVSLATAPYCNVLLPTIDLKGIPRGGVGVTVDFLAYLPGAVLTAVVVDDDAVTTSDGSGIATMQLLRLAKYRAKYKVLMNKEKYIEFETPDSGSYTVVEG